MRPSHRVAIGLICWLAVAAPARAEQETLARVKDYYASAAYEEALDVLRKLNVNAPPNETREAAVYQLLCLLALGRNEETKKAIETIVHADPLYHLSEAQASPRVRLLFEDVRRPLIPEIIRQLYAKAKSAFDRKDLPAAATEFDRVIALLDEAELPEIQGAADLRTLATGFRDLSRVPVIAPPTASPPPATQEPPAPKSAAPRIYGPGDANIIRPVAISQVLPPWRPEAPGDQRQDFRGDLELLIDETGKVATAVLRRSVHRLYDPALVDAALKWKFQPATVSGSPVKYRYVMEIHLQRSR